MPNSQRVGPGMSKAVYVFCPKCGKSWQTYSREPKIKCPCGEMVPVKREPSERVRTK